MVGLEKGGFSGGAKGCGSTKSDLVAYSGWRMKISERDGNMERG
jgi:hypothetical protein